MIQIQTEGAFVILKVGNREIILHEMEYFTFKEEIFVLRAGNRVQIEPKELSFVHYNLLFHKHAPCYNRKDLDMLDIKPLLKKYNWVSKIN